VLRSRAAGIWAHQKDCVRPVPVHLVVAREIAGLVESGAIKPVIDREFAFEQLPAALGHLETGRARGKVVLKVK